MSQAAAFRDYADWAAGHSRLYERLSRGSAADDDLLGMVEAVPEGQPAPNLLLAAVHDLLLSGITSPLAAFYATCTDDPVDPESRDPFPIFKRFCLEHETAIRDRLENRLVQTNDPGVSVTTPTCRHVRFVGGDATGERLGTFGAYGSWIEWDAD